MLLDFLATRTGYIHPSLLVLAVALIVIGAIALVWGSWPSRSDRRTQADADRNVAALAARIRGAEDDADLAVELHTMHADTLAALNADLLSDRRVARTARKFATAR